MPLREAIRPYRLGASAVVLALRLPEAATAQEIRDKFTCCEVRASGKRCKHGLDICLPGISAAQQLETAVIKASLAHAAAGTVRPERIVSEGNILESVDIGGDTVFAKQAQLVRTAKKEVIIQTFAWDPGSPGAEMILDALLEALHSSQQQASSSDASHERLRVRLLINEGTGFAQNFMRLTSANKNRSGPKRWPSHPEALVGNFKKSSGHKYAPLTRDLDFQVRVHQHSSSNSIHAKSVIVDGARAAVTGANVQSRNHGENPAYGHLE